MAAVRVLAFSLAGVIVGTRLLEADCSLTSTGNIPINDLGLGTHHDFQGGLYPGASNQRPVSHEAAGVALAGQIQPLDAMGNPDPENGRIILLSVGMSNTRQEFSSGAANGDPALAVRPRANADLSKNPRVDIFNGTQGGRDAAAWVNPEANAWKNVLDNLQSSGRGPLQVQAVWQKQARARPANLGAFPQHAEILRDDLRAIVRNIALHFPNCRVIYISPRTRSYALVHEAPLNPESFA